jgi:adenylate kinase
LINFLEKNDLKISNIFDLKVKDTKIIERIKYRSSIENREDDKEDIIKNRISKYISETKPLSDFYLKNYIENYHQVNANQEIENIHEDILKITKK